MSEIKTISPLLMDRSEALGNSIDPTGRRALHVLAQGGILQIQGVSVQGRIQQVTVPVVSWVAAPAVPLAGRNSLLIQNTSNRAILWNYTNNPAVTIGFSIPAGGYREVLITDQVTVYLRTTGAPQTVIVEELA